MPMLEPEFIRRVASCFPAHRTTATDAFALRHFSMLSAQALRCVAVPSADMEALGTVPHQFWYPLGEVIPKATSGLRPLGVFCALADCGPDGVVKWHRRGEDQHPRSFFATSKERAVTDPVTGHAVTTDITRSHRDASSTSASSTTNCGSTLCA